MYPFSITGETYRFMQDQYLRVLESSIKVSKEITENWWFAWDELMSDPYALVRRNYDYFEEVVRPPEAEWQTLSHEIHLPEPYSKIIRLLDFSGPETVPGEIIPTLILPPQAGHHSYIADYSPEQSQVQILRQNGLGKIFCIEWLEATQETKHVSIDDYIDSVTYCLDQLGGKANLIGDCQGGWLATIFAALYPEKVNSLVVAGAPIDYQAGEGQIKEAVNLNAQLFPEGGMSFYRSLVGLNDGLLDGRMMVTGFNIMKPGQTSLRYLSLYRDIHDPVKLQRFREMKNWYDFTQNIAGDFYLWIVEHLFRDNKLIKGELVVKGRKVDLKQIECPVFLLGGTRDHVTPPEQVFAMANYVSTSPDKIKQYLVEAGHIGLFMGKDILTGTWSQIGRQIEAYSNSNPQLLNV